MGACHEIFASMRYTCSLSELEKHLSVDYHQCQSVRKRFSSFDSERVDCMLGRVANADQAQGVARLWQYASFKR